LEELGVMIGSLRLSRGWSLEQFAARSGVSVTDLASIESGATYLSLLMLTAILNALGLMLFASFRSG
jgi:transcriptional regulator with XRE-family HTH domain